MIVERAKQCSEATCAFAMLVDVANGLYGHPSLCSDLVTCVDVCSGFSFVKDYLIEP